MREAGFTVIDYFAVYNNSATPDTVQRTVQGYIEWIQNLPLFDQAIEQGWVDRPTLDNMCTEMKEWSERPDAFLATAGCRAVGRKE